jgi:hypothetical protein
LRRAYAIIKNFPMMAVVEKDKATIMPTANDGDDSVNDPTDALEQLEALVARLRASAPWMSKAQAFAKTYAEHPELAAKERRQAYARMRV